MNHIWYDYRGNTYRLTYNDNDVTYCVYSPPGSSNGCDEQQTSSKKDGPHCQLGVAPLLGTLCHTHTPTTIWTTCSCRQSDFNNVNIFTRTITALVMRIYQGKHTPHGLIHAAAAADAETNEKLVPPFTWCMRASGARSQPLSGLTTATVAGRCNTQQRWTRECACAEQRETRVMRAHSTLTTQHC